MRFIHWRSLVCGLILGLILVASTGKAHRLSGHPHSLRGKLELAKAQVRHDRVSSDPWLARDKRYVRQLLSAVRPTLRPPHYFQWLCIHRGEAAWNDPNPPFYGGLQMDWGFMATYGGRLLRMKGTADHWTPLEQMWVAERAHRTRGFYPWPTTARRCGLL